MKEETGKSRNKQKTPSSEKKGEQQKEDKRRKLYEKGKKGKK